MKRILVADDSVTIQKVIALTFADEPFEVQSVGTGAEALELVKSWKPDIVLADVIMPQMNGYELCRAVKQQAESRTTPVLLLAGTFEAFDEEEARSVGADDFITKPFESGELIDKVKGLLGAEQGASASPEPAGAGPAPQSSPRPPEQPASSQPPQPSAAPSQPQPQAAPPQVPQGETAEPDIWDILSDTDSPDQSSAGSQSGSPAPGFGGVEDEGVVDVGSFDVGLDRPEWPQTPPPVEPPAPQAPAQQTPIQQAPTQQTPTQQAPHDQALETRDRSRVENMEKDFFGFETGAVEEIHETDLLEEAVEEVTFEMDEPPAGRTPSDPEASFVVPEPAGQEPGGETISPDLLAPAPQSAAEPAPASTQPPAEGVSPPVPPGPIPGPEASPQPQAPPQEEEPPLELSVDLAPDFSDEAAPPTAPETAAPKEAPTPAPPRQDAGGADDAAMRRIIEEKVEKVVWEVVPEMAEVLIKETIRKIREGT